MCVFYVKVLNGGMFLHDFDSDAKRERIRFTRLGWRVVWIIIKKNGNQSKCDCEL